MTDTNKCGFSARILIILLAAALTIMLFASLKARIQNPHLTVAARQQQGMAGGEAGAEAVVPLATLWDKLETMITSVFNTASTTGGSSGEGLTSTAGRLLTLDDFSLGSLADSGGVVVYYDFSGFTWSPQIQTEGTGDDADDFMAKLKAHEAEFFDWLEEFIKMREVAQYA